MEVLTRASLVALLGLLISTAPMVMGVIFAIQPTERRLALMRPLSLAGIFAAVCSLLVGVANGLYPLSRDALDPANLRLAALTMSEAVITTFVAFACLTVAWLCVAMGMRKHS